MHTACVILFVIFFSSLSLFKLVCLYIPNVFVQSYSYVQKCLFGLLWQKEQENIHLTSLLSMLLMWMLPCPIESLIDIVNLIYS